MIYKKMEKFSNLPVKGSVAVLLVLEVMTFIAFAIGPLKSAKAVHFVVSPHAFVPASIVPVVRTYFQKPYLSLNN